MQAAAGHGLAVGERHDEDAGRGEEEPGVLLRLAGRVEAEAAADLREVAADHVPGRRRCRVDRLERHRGGAHQQVGLAEGPGEAFPLPAGERVDDQPGLLVGAALQFLPALLARLGQADQAAPAVAGVGDDLDEAVPFQAAQEPAEVTRSRGRGARAALACSAGACRRGLGVTSGRSGCVAAGAAPISNSRRAGPSGMPRPRKESSSTPMRWV